MVRMWIACITFACVKTVAAVTVTRVIMKTKKTTAMKKTTKTTRPAKAKKDAGTTKTGAAMPSPVPVTEPLYFSSNETLEACDATVSQDGSITVDPLRHNADAMARLGGLRAPLRGRVRVEEGLVQFTPYALGLRPPTYLRQKRVGVCKVSVLPGSVKLEMTLARTDDKQLFLREIAEEWKSLVWFLDNGAWFDRYVSTEIDNKKE